MRLVGWFLVLLVWFHCGGVCHLFWFRCLVFFDCLGLVCLGFLVCVFLGSFLSIAENLRTEAVLAMVCLKEILIS